QVREFDGFICVGDSPGEILILVRIAPLVCHRPEVHGQHGSAVAQELGAAIRKGIIGSFVGVVPGVFDFFKVIAGGGLQKIHIVMGGGGIFFAELNRV